jgi:signal transduction histidine kinase
LATKEQPSAPASAFWPWQHSLQYRILFAYGAVFLATVVLLVIWIGDAIYRADLDAGKHEVEVAALLAANTLEDPLSGFTEEFDKSQVWDELQRDGERSTAGAEGVATPSGEGAVAGARVGGEVQPVPGLAELLPRLQQVANRYADDTHARVTIYNTQGYALADSQTPIRTIGSLTMQADLQTVLQNARPSGAIIDAHPAASEGGELAILAAAPIEQSDRLLGAVQISKPLAAVTADARSVLLRMALAALAALVVATALAIWIGRRLVQPLRKLEDAAFAVAEGDLTQTVPVESYDEVGALARAFNYMVREVRAMLQQQRAFVANASHELRTPLANIKLRSEALRTLHAANPQLEARYLSEIEAEADRLTRLANDLLDLARLEEAEPLAPADLQDVAPILREAAGIMQLRAEEAKLSLYTAIADNLPRVCVRAEDLEIIAVNLLDNAVKYTQPGGEVRLQAVSVAGGVQIRVQDNGPGIPGEDAAHVFERFYRVDKARSRRASAGASVGSGAGLGLAIVHNLVSQNGGHIRVERAAGAAGEAGEGTVFVVSFPAVA